MWAVLVLLATVIALVFYRAAQRPSHFPPGPLCLPLLGSILSIIPSPKDSFMRFQKKYGDLCSFRVFNVWTILINDPDLMRSTGVDIRFSGRPPLYLFFLRNALISGKEEPLGIIGTSGDVWKHQRRFTLRSLKDKGFGRNSIEPIMQSELAELGDYFASQGNKKISVSYSQRDLGSRHRQAIFQSFDPFNPALNFRFIKTLFPNLEVFKRIDGYMTDLLDFLQEQLTTHSEEMGDDDDFGSYVGDYNKEIKESKEAGKETPLNIHHLKANVVELFLGGSETTSSTLSWAVYILASHPEVQEKMQEELDNIVGPGNLPTFDHMNSLPYTCAAMYEIQRYADLVPFAVPHRLLDDVDMGGYHFPKGTDVLYNLTYALKSPKHWKHPDKFYPEHFLTPEGKIHKPDAFMPFGYGKRVCLGESLARLELFLFLSNLVHRFSWKKTDDPVTWEKATVLSRPPVYTVYVTERHCANGETRTTGSA